jgi:hypothetical protein
MASQRCLLPMIGKGTCEQAQWLQESGQHPFWVLQVGHDLPERLYRLFGADDAWVLSWVWGVCKRGHGGLLSERLQYNHDDILG